MKVGCLEKALPIELQPIDKDKGVYNLYVPGSLNIKEIKDMLLNPPEYVQYIAIYDCKGEDRWRHMIEKIGEELNIKWYRFDRDNFVHYIVDLKDQMPEEYR